MTTERICRPEGRSAAEFAPGLSGFVERLPNRLSREDKPRKKEHHEG
jgi:hypothetical protein